MLAGVLSVAVAPAVLAVGSMTYVTPDSPSDWVDMSVFMGKVEYVDGAPVGLGNSSLMLSTPDQYDSQAIYEHSANIALSDVSELSYWTKQYNASNPNGSANLWLSVDFNGDGLADSNLTYEPYWQDNNYDAAPVVAGVWQKQDVAGGLVWSSRTYTDGTNTIMAGYGGLPSYTFASIKSMFPTARILTVGVVVGDSTPNYAIGVDGISLNGGVYNFEKVIGDTAVPVQSLDCKDGNWKTLFTVDGIPFRNQGQCVSYTTAGKLTPVSWTK